MNNILFYARTYWEIHWLYPLIKATNNQVYAEDQEAKDVAVHLGIELYQKTDRTVLVTCVMHMGQNKAMIDHFLNTGGKVVLLQHAWDSSVSIPQRFWDIDTSRFDVYCVGSTQDEQWLSATHGEEKIINTGMPRLDTLYEVSQEEDFSDIYNLLGTERFFISILPDPGVHGKRIEQRYKHNLLNESPIPVFYKLHPGGNYLQTDELVKRENSNLKLLDDSRYDIKQTYRLIKASQGVVCVESFLAIEASLLKVPLIFYAIEDLPTDWYQSEQNVKQNERTTPEMSSRLSHPEYTEAQKDIAGLYRFDGKNTDRVIKVLEKL